MTRADRIAQVQVSIDDALRALTTAVDTLNTQIDATAAARLARIAPLETERAHLDPFLVFQEPATVARVEALREETEAIEVTVRAALDDLYAQREALYVQTDQAILAKKAEIARISAEPEPVPAPSAPSAWERFKAWVLR